jgi:DNA-binding response OmpR family regulator
VPRKTRHSNAGLVSRLRVDTQVMEILVVEDEVRLAQHICRTLTEAGHEPVLVHDGETALGKTEVKRYDLIVLDVMLPGMDGFEVLRHLRATKIDTRVLILTARGEVSDRVTGLGLGADDYLAKPFAMQELVARVNALGRRFPEEAPIKLQIGDLVLNLLDRKLHRGRRRIDLSAREFTLLRALMREPGRVFSRTELCERVWEREHEYGVKLVEAFISRLRKKIDSPALIHTVRHLGYTIGERE